MFFRRFVVGGLLLMLVFGALGGMRRNTYHAGYERGYEAGLREAASESAESATDGKATSGQESGEEGQNGRSEHSHYHSRYHGHGYGHGHHWGFAPFGFFGFLLKFFFFMFLMKMLFKFLGWGRWRHGHRPPWDKGGKGDDESGEEPYEKQPEDVEPDVRSA
ncbi:MAG: hypothetical protein AAF614_09200 [Chloroflexota bacterium]